MANNHKRSRYSQEKIVEILNELQGSGQIGAVSIKYGVSQHTLERWVGRYGTLGRYQIERLNFLESENRELKRINERLKAEVQAYRQTLNRLGN